MEVQRGVGFSRRSSRRLAELVTAHEFHGDGNYTVHPQAVPTNVGKLQPCYFAQSPYLALRAARLGESPSVPEVR